MVGSWAAAAPAGPARSGIWLFDRAPSYPGVVMMELARDGRSGTLTTSWYGAIPIQGLRPVAHGVAFTIRNLNDPAHPVRRWTARFDGNTVRLAGDLWHAHVEQVGHPGTPGQGRVRAFHPVALSPAEARSHMVLWAMATAPLLMGHDLRRTDAAALALLVDRDLLAVDQDRLGVQGRLVRRDGAVELWRKPLADGRVALALVNRGTAPRSIAVGAADAGLDRVAAWRAVGPAAPVAGSGGEKPVPPHDAVVLLAEPGGSAPHL